MKSKQQVLEKIITAQSCLAQLRLDDPENHELRLAKILLDDLENEFYKGWPLENTEKATSLGIYAAKNLSDGPYKDLPKLMIDLAGDMDAGD